MALTSSVVLGFRVPLEGSYKRVYKGYSNKGYYKGLV